MRKIINLRADRDFQKSCKRNFKEMGIGNFVNGN